TWDDSGDTPTYKYFAKGTDSFYQTHTPCTPEGVGSYFQYDLPEISTSDYKVPVATETTTETTTTTTETTTTTTETTTTTTETTTTTTETTATTSETTTTTSETTTTTPITTTSTTAPQPIKGDINGDGIFNIADVLILQKYLLCEIELDNPENADFYPDNIINSFDLCCMKSALLKK
ncbi:MAG: dockerin type I repeat-containing protein, partial [Ruminococcus sp.]